MQILWTYYAKKMQRLCKYDVKTMQIMCKYDADTMQSRCKIMQRRWKQYWNNMNIRCKADEHKLTACHSHKMRGTFGFSISLCRFRLHFLTNFRNGRGNLFFHKNTQKIPPFRPIFRQSAFFRASAGPFFDAIFEAIFGLNLRISFLEKGLKCTPVDADFHAGCIFGTWTGTADFGSRHWPGFRTWPPTKTTRWGKQKKTSGAGSRTWSPANTTRFGKQKIQELDLRLDRRPTPQDEENKKFQELDLGLDRRPTSQYAENKTIQELDLELDRRPTPRDAENKKLQELDLGLDRWPTPQYAESKKIQCKYDANHMHRWCNDYANTI